METNSAECVPLGKEYILNWRTGEVLHWPARAPDWKRRSDIWGWILQKLFVNGRELFLIEEIFKCMEGVAVKCPIILFILYTKDCGAEKDHYVIFES